MESLKLGQILTAVGGEVLSRDLDETIEITSVSIDSREIKQGGLYIPIKGEKFDGHVFIEEAFKKGARIALTQNKLDSSLEGILIYVKDTKKALMNLSKYYRDQFHIPVVAVTGSVGKTSTKDLIAAVLSSKYRVHKTQGNFNNEIGLPLTILGLEKTHQVLVVEMGMNHFGEIHHLSQIASPDLAVITNIGVSHIENLGSQEGILKAKCEILDGMTSGGVLIVNGEDQMLKNLRVSQNLVTYGREKKHPIFAQDIKTDRVDGISAVFKTPTWQGQIVIPALGDHMIDNALAAISVADLLNLSKEDVEEGFKLYKPSEMRMDLKLAKNNVYIINDTYNASPDSMRAALGVLATIPNIKRRIAILGDMFELGVHAKAFHLELGEDIGKKEGLDLLITVGQMSEYIREGAIKAGFNADKALHFESQEDLITSLKNLIKPGDLVLVKASRGMELEKTVDEIGKVK